MLKKIVSILMAVVCVFSLCTVAFAVPYMDLPAILINENDKIEETPVRSAEVKAIPISSGFDALDDCFTSVKASNGKYYSYYNPTIDKNDKTKYPVVIYLHGKFHAFTNESYDDSGLTYWASSEMQGKFKEGGAHLIAPKIPELSLPITYKDKALAIIKEYVNKNKNNIDMTQIYIMGGSAGGGLATKLILDEPDYFKKAVLLCSTGDINAKEAKTLVEMPIWVVSAKTDPLINISRQVKNFSNITAVSKVPNECRMTTFNNHVTLPNGSRPGISHFLAKTIGYNFCTISDQKLFTNMTTIDGKGRNINLSFDNSIIEWLQTPIIK